MDDLREIPLSVNDLVEVSVPDDEASPVYSSRVEDIIEGQVILGWPTCQGVCVPLHKDTILSICFTRRETAYNVNALITELCTGEIARIAVQPLAASRQVQRREYFRIRSLIPIQLKGVISPGENAGPMHILTHTFDISGSGLSIHQSFPLAVGAMFEARISLNRQKPALKLQTRVVHCERISNARARPVYRIAVTYVDIAESQRRAIVRHVFEVQRSSLAG